MNYNITLTQMTGHEGTYENVSSLVSVYNDVTDTIALKFVYEGADYYITQIMSYAKEPVNGKSVD